MSFRNLKHVSHLNCKHVSNKCVMLIIETGEKSLRFLLLLAMLIVRLLKPVYSR